MIETCSTLITYLSLHSNGLLFKIQLLGSLKRAFHYVKRTVTQKQTVAILSTTGFQNFRAIECVDNKNKLPKNIHVL